MFLVEMFQRKTTMPTAAEALAGRADPVETASTHFVNGRPLKGPFPQGSEIAYFAMGRFSAAEKLFWPLHGVHVTAAGYAGGLTPQPDLSGTDDKPHRAHADSHGGLRPDSHQLPRPAQDLL